jgi:GT2 family glycosyltransferase
LLDRLAEQTLGQGAFEVVIVSDGASVDTDRVLAGRPVEVVRLEPARGPAGARNAGWRCASAQYVAFVDDDCRPAADWLERLLAAAAPGRLVQGRTVPDPAEAASDGLFSRTLRVDALGPQYETCNILYPRAVLEALDGFDEGYGFTPGGEDTDLAWRAIEDGVEPRFAADAVVYHAVERLGALGALRVAARWTRTMRVFANHPQARSMLYRGAFWNVWHYLLWRSLAALLAPGWLRRMILTLHLVQLRRRCLQAGAGSWAIPYLLVHDLVECWAVARGGLRYRVPVL